MALAVYFITHNALGAIHKSHDNSKVCTAIYRMKACQWASIAAVNWSQSFGEKLPSFLKQFTYYFPGITHMYTIIHLYYYTVQIIGGGGGG